MKEMNRIPALRELNFLSSWRDPQKHLTGYFDCNEL